MILFRIKTVCELICRFLSKKGILVIVLLIQIMTSFNMGGSLIHSCILILAFHTPTMEKAPPPITLASTWECTKICYSCTISIHNHFKWLHNFSFWNTHTLLTRWFKYIPQINFEQFAYITQYMQSYYDAKKRNYEVIFSFSSDKEFLSSWLPTYFFRLI